MLTPDTSALQPASATEFQDLVNGELASVPSFFPDFELFLDTQSVYPDPPELGDYGVILDALDQGMSAASIEDPSAGLDAIDTSSTNMSAQLAFIGREAPGEAFQPIPDPYLVPGQPVTVANELGPVTISIANLSRPGASDFMVGETFSLTVDVTSGGGVFLYANQAIKLKLTQNNGAPIEVPLPNTDQFGETVFRSQFKQADAGFWTAQTDPPGSGTPAKISWTVGYASAPAPGVPPPATPPAVTVLLLNFTDPSSTNFHEGDMFTLKVVGPPNCDVFVDIQHDGQDLGESKIGHTDASGLWTGGGTIQPGSVGRYTETYRVCTTPAPAPIQFVVLSTPGK
jgi:hypothetical protein